MRIPFIAGNWKMYTDSVEAEALAVSLKRLLADGVDKILAGLTTAEEVVKVAGTLETESDTTANAQPVAVAEEG